MRRTTKFLPIIAAALVLGACDDDLGGPDGGRLSIRLTDAPGALAEAHVMIDHFVLVGDEGSITIEAEEGDFIDLLELAGGQALEIVGDEPVAEGSYSELRLVLEAAYVVLDDEAGTILATPGADLPVGVEADGELKCPSCAQSGFKVKFSNGGLVVDEDTDVLIDFDVAQSFVHEAGNSGKWIMHPVLHATTESTDMATITGTVALNAGFALPACGGVTPNLENFKPTVTVGTDVRSAVVGTNGTFTMRVPVGTYTLGFAPTITLGAQTLTFVAAPNTATLELTKGQTANVTYTITGATCQ